MKRTVPLLITAIVGFVLVCSAFVPAAESWGEKALIWFDLLAGIAFILGGANLVGSQLKKISARRRGWGYALVTLVAFVITLTVGVLKLGVRPAQNQEFYGESFAPLPVDQLPAVTIDAAISDDVRSEQLPPSVRRQVTFTDAGLRVAGWLTPSQVADLSEVQPTLDWQCSIEKLAGLAVPPPAFRGRLAYRPDHQALSFKGVLSDVEKTELAQLAPESEPFRQAADNLAEKSNRKFSVAEATPPPGFELPPALASRAVLSDSTIQWTGPMSMADRTALALGSLRSRIAYPMGAEQLAAFQASLTADGPLNEDQQKAIARIASKDFSEDLIATINTAGVSAPGAKSACELVAERDSGVADLDPVIPAAPAVELNPAQKQAITAFVKAQTHDWTALETALKAAGPLTGSQSAAISEFQQKLPTIGQRNRQIFDELAMSGRLTPAQRQFLLKDYEVERTWQAAVARLFFTAHEVKYAWSGEFNQQGSRFWWLFEYIFQPIQSMMFALLAFYVASAAFRAFRAKNVEAILLLGTAFIILLGRTYVGSLATAWLPRESPLRLENLSVDIMRVFNSAGNRAIMIGIALGIASTSLKILLGIDRSHIGGKD
ncbi:hypothetical protein Pan44_48740 [Caulifigura coniformis]|uniref:Uncharacterized protein n=1 Tax=Caulifigura coniformis TaxID=2527983 RepID=A0A517SL13_9PLAN|nr:hypothetical protein [Caulifigura coniformis]QDT56814.1 hypothetical protein Pan44_48740 [Caulifigura coniformis]